MSLRLLYLIFARLCSWLVLLGRSRTSKNAESLVLRHRVSCAAPHQARPSLDWAGRAVLAALIRLLPHQLRGHRLVTPGTVWRARTRAEDLTWASILCARSLSPHLSAGCDPAGSARSLPAGRAMACATRPADASAAGHHTTGGGHREK